MRRLFDRPWRWRVALDVELRPFYEQHGFRGQEQVVAAVESEARLAAGWLAGVEGVPEGHLAALRWLPDWAGAIVSTDLWLGASARWFPSALLLVVRVPSDDLLAQVRSRISAPKLHLGPVDTCARSPWSETHGFRRAAAREFLARVFESGAMPGHWMADGSGIVLPNGVSDCDSILGVLEAEGVISRGAYSPNWSTTRAPTCGDVGGAASRAKPDVFRREANGAVAKFVAGIDVYYGHYVWHPVRANEARAREMLEAE